MDDVEAAISTLCFASETKELEACLETDKFEELFKLLQSIMKKGTSIKWNGTSEEKNRIAIYTEMFDNFCQKYSAYYSPQSSNHHSASSDISYITVVLD